MSQAVTPGPEPSALDIFNSLPDISGPEFDALFDEIERFRHHPAMMQVRDVEL